MLKKGLCIICAVVVAVVMTTLCFAENMSTPGVTAEVYDIETGEQLADDLDALQEIVENSDKFDMAEDPVLTVVVPSSLDFLIDPFKVNGRGQVYSDDFVIQNYSDKDVQINLNNIKYAFKNNEDFVSLDAPPDIPFGLGHVSEYKEIYMTLSYVNKDLKDFVITDKEMSESADIILSASKYDEDGNFVSLDEGSVLIFTFSGIVNHMPSAEWEQGDVTVSIEYMMAALDEESNDEDETELAEGSIAKDSETGNISDISSSEDPQTTDSAESVESESPQTPDALEPADVETGGEAPEAEAPSQEITTDEDIADDDEKIPPESQNEPPS